MAKKEMATETGTETVKDRAPEEYGVKGNAFLGGAGLWVALLFSFFWGSSLCLGGFGVGG